MLPETPMKRFVRDYSMLVRARVSFMVAAAAAFGYLLVSPVPHAGLAWTMAGTGLLAWACSAWNQVQEQDLDALLPRTASRPVPQGRISPRTALCLGLVFAALAVFCLYRAGGFVPVLAACLIVLVYNGLYTPLKRRSGFALLVGASVGALPPVIGWLCAGGDAAAPELLLVYGVYVLWQVPHFWLRVQHDGAAYALAGLPVPAVQFCGPRYTRLLGVWFHAYAAAVLLLPVFPFISGAAARAGLALLGLVLFVGGGMALRSASAPRVLSRITDGGMVATMVIVLADRLFVF